MKPDIHIGEFEEGTSDEDETPPDIAANPSDQATAESSKKERMVIVSKLKQENKDDPPVFLVRFETEHRQLFRYWKYTGVLLVHWEEEEGEGTYVQKYYSFIVCYAILIILMMIGTAVCLVSGFFSDHGRHVELPEVLEMTGLLFTVTVVPSVQAYSIKLLFETLPEIFTEIGRLNYLTLPERPGTVPLKEILLFGLVTRTHSSELRKLKDNRNATLDDVIHWLPFIAIIVSVTIFLLVLVVGIVISTVDGSVLTNDWKSFVVYTTICLSYPIHITGYAVRVMMWMKSIFEALTLKFVKIGIRKKNAETNSQEDSAKWIDALAEIEDQLNTFTRLIQSIQDGFLKFLLSINLFTFMIVAMLSLTKLLKQLEMIIFLVPLIESLYMAALLCYGAESVLNKHHHLLKVVMKFADQNLPQLTPAEQHRLVCFQTSLEQHPPFLTTYSNLKLTMGLLVNLTCFVLSYGVILSQVMTQDVMEHYDFETVLHWVTEVSTNGCVDSCNKTVTE